MCTDVPRRSLFSNFHLIDHNHSLSGCQLSHIFSLLHKRATSAPSLVVVALPGTMLHFYDCLLCHYYSVFIIRFLSLDFQSSHRLLPSLFFHVDFSWVPTHHSLFYFFTHFLPASALLLGLLFPSVVIFELLLSPPLCPSWLYVPTCRKVNIEIEERINLHVSKTPSVFFPSATSCNT